MDREDEFLLALSRTHIEKALLESLRALLVQDVDWRELLRRADYHRVIPLVYLNLRRHYSNVVPKSTLVALQQRHNEIARKNLLLVAQLQKVIKLLESRGISSIPYKGPVTALIVYGNLSLRQFGDLDIWVDPTDFAEAKQILERSGYLLAVEYGWEASLVDGTTGICIDLHRGITPDNFPVHLVFAELCERASQFSFVGRDVNILSAEDLLIVLCIQLAKDAWETKPLRLSKVCDIAALLHLSNKTIHWEKVFEQAQTHGCQRILSVGLITANRMLGAPLADSVLSKFRGEAGIRFDPLVRQLYYELFEENKNKGTAPVSKVAFYLRLRERWYEKLFPYYYSCIVRLIPSEKDRQFIRLPDSMQFLYFVVRPIRIARELPRRLRVALTKLRLRCC